jgi:hypothetical protein
MSHVTEAKKLTHSGACHCGAVQFEFDTESKHFVAWDCNCSICALKRNVHTMVDKRDFRLLKGEDSLTEYTFGTGVAKHKFCKVCGVQAFYSPRSNPHSWAVTIACIKPGTFDSVETKFYDGKNWESSYKATGIAAHDPADKK